jgi:hypothetical protein
MQSTPCGFVYIPGEQSLTRRQYVLPREEDPDEEEPSSSPPLKRQRAAIMKSIVSLTSDTPAVANDLDKSPFYNKSGFHVLLSQSDALPGLAHLTYCGYETPGPEEGHDDVNVGKYSFIDKTVYESLGRIIEAVFSVIKSECEAAPSDLKKNLYQTEKVRYSS